MVEAGNSHSKVGEVPFEPGANVDDLTFDSPATFTHPFAVVDWFLPETLRQASEGKLRRARLTVVTSFLIGLAISGALLADGEPESETMRLVTQSLALILLFAPILLKCRVPAQVIENGLVAMIFSHAMLLAATTGGADSGSVFLAVLVPLVAVLLCGTWVGTAWSLLTFVSLVGIAIAVQGGFEAPVHPDPGNIALWNLRAGIMGILVALGIALVQAWLRESGLRVLAEAHDRANQAHQLRLDDETRFRTQLESLVKERTQELMDSRMQLRRSDRLATIGTLAAGIAHEINNPMGLILLSSQFALSSKSESGNEAILREALESNVVNVERCGRIVENLLRFSRNEPTEKADLDLNEVTHRALANLSEPTSQFEVQLTREALPILASEIEIEQVIINLVDNAIQSGQPEASKIEIRTERRGDVALIHVIDQGKGIEDKDRERIFDPLFTTRINEGGTGLGLSVVHGIVEGHRGNIEVESEVGVGTRVSVSLPINTGRADGDVGSRRQEPGLTQDALTA